MADEHHQSQPPSSPSPPLPGGGRKDSAKQQEEEEVNPETKSKSTVRCKNNTFFGRHRISAAITRLQIEINIIKVIAISFYDSQIYLNRHRSDDKS